MEYRVNSCLLSAYLLLSVSHIYYGKNLNYYSQLHHMLIDPRKIYFSKASEQSYYSIFKKPVLDRIENLVY